MKPFPSKIPISVFPAPISNSIISNKNYDYRDIAFIQCHNSFNNIYNKITNSNKNIAIITDSKWNELKKEYISNISSGKKYEYVNEPELLFEDVKKNDIISSSAVDLFGSDIVEIE